MNDCDDVLPSDLEYELATEEDPDCPVCGGSGGGFDVAACRACRGTGRRHPYSPRSPAYSVRGSSAPHPGAWPAANTTPGAAAVLRHFRGVGIP